MPRRRLLSIRIPLTAELQLGLMIAASTGTLIDEDSFRQSHPITLEHLPSPLLHADVGPLYHLAPSLRFRGDEGRCLLGGTEHRRKALLSETLAVFRG